MRLIINKALNNTNDVVNLKIIELDSADLLNNSIDYFSYKYQIPLIKFTDTGEVFNIRNFKNRIDLSLTETELILDETDLELISSTGGGGGSQDLQSVLDNGSTANNVSIQLNNTDNNISVEYSGQEIYISDNGTNNYGDFTANEITFYNEANEGSTQHYENGKIRLESSTAGIDVSLNFNRDTTGVVVFNIPEKVTGTYTIATLEDIYAVGALIPTYADNAAAVTGGLALHGLYKTATGEIRVRV